MFILRLAMKWFKELFTYKELVQNLTIKDIKIRYKTTALGFLWALMNPLLLMLVFFLVFSFIVKIQIEKYPVFLITALIPWFFLSSSLSAATTSLVDNTELIKKVFFPRQIVPLSVVLVNAFNFLLSLIAIFIFLLIFQVPIKAPILLLPIVFLMQTIFIFGLTLIFSCLYVFFRDTRYIIEIFLVCWFYFSPIFYPISMVPQQFSKPYMLNPMAGFITLYRDILLYAQFPQLPLVLYVFSCSLFVLLLGFFVFKRQEGVFTDLL